ncbi:MAG: ABC transporter substrate-binding protein [Actinomycetota bacterium]
MTRRRMPAAVSLLVVLALTGAACSKNKTAGNGTAKKGGIFRMQTQAFEWNSTLDPTSEYLGLAFEFFNAMHRTLLGYNHKSGTDGGNTVIPDLAVALPTVSSDGLTYTLKIHSGVKFAPPVNRVVTTKDIVTAFERLADPTLSAGGYPTYYEDIVGFKAAEALKTGPRTISGITTPDDTTIVFKLDKPVGDFPFRLTLAATAPMPHEVSDCFKKNGDYGRYQIATGPYMIEGTDKLNISSCATLTTPISGFDPLNFLKLVRNPNYDPSTDTPGARADNIDGVDLEKNTNVAAIFQNVIAGTIDGSIDQPPGDIVKKGETDPTVQPLFHVDAGDRTWYLFMNMTKPPFDDLHIRKAVNWIIDKAAMLQARGGPPAGLIAEHIVPPNVLGGKLQPGEFDPYKSDGEHGDLAKAEAEVKLSKYAHSSAGLCTDPACKNVLFQTRNTQPFLDQMPIVVEDLAKIGITLAARPIAKFYSTVQVPTITPPLGGGAGWGKDYADASTFFVPLLASNDIAKTATQNFAFLGLTKAQAQADGISYPAGGVPSADSDINTCEAKIAPDDRNNCWAALDQHLMNDVAPWVPTVWGATDRLVSSAVTTYVYDQFAGEISFVQIALDTSKQKTA